MPDPEIVILHALLLQVRARLAALHRGQAGYSAETAIVIALLSIAAITALTIIVKKIISAAKGVQIN